MQVRVLAERDRSAWDAWVATRSDGGFMQSWDWSLFKAGEGYVPLRLGCFAGDRLVGGLIAYRFPAPVEAALAAVPDGPVLDWMVANAPEVFDALVTGCRDAAGMETVSVLRLEPRVQLHAAPAWLTTLPRGPLDLVPDETLDVPLGPEEVLLAAMRPKGRYNVRLAQRRGVTAGSTADAAAVHEFYPVMEQTARYHDFRLEPKPFFVNLAQVLCPAGAGRFSFARYKGITLAAAFTVRCADTVTFLYGGHLPLFPDVMASYALHYHVMCEAYREGYRRYDFFGYVPPGTPEHSYDGFSRFKEKLGGQPVRRVGSRDILFYDRLADAAIRVGRGA